MISFQNILTIVKKELRSYFDNPTAYIVMVVFLLLWEFLFFRNVFLVGETSLSLMFQVSPWLLLFLISALTMGSISQETSEGTLEILLTHPLKDIELILGKFLSVLIFVSLVHLFILPIAIAFEIVSSLDWGIFFTQLLASFLLSGLLASLGIFISSLVKGQIASLFLTLISGFLFLILGYDLVTAVVPFSLAQILERVSALSHQTSMIRGVIDARDMWYFLSVTVFFLSLAYLQFLKRRYGNRKQVYRNYQMGMIMFLLITILSAVLGEMIPGRIDLTNNRIFTLSNATKQTISTLPDVVQIKFYASSELPAQLLPVKRDVQDLLRDYKAESKGNITVEIKNPSGDADVVQEAVADGIQEVQFNVIGDEELQVKNGYLGLAISYADQKESIPYIQTTNDIEYQITSLVKKITVKNKKKVYFLASHGEKSPFGDYRILNAELQKEFEVDEITIDEETTEISSDVTVLVIAGPTDAFDEKTQVAIKDYLDRGGEVLALVDGVDIDMQLLQVTKSANNLNDLLGNYGVTVESNLVYDQKSNELVSFGGGMGYILPYPYWMKVQLSEEIESPLFTAIPTFVMPWGSSVTIDTSKLEGQGLTLKRYYQTTDYAGVTTDNFNITPNQLLPNENLQKYDLGVLLENESKSWKIMLIGDSDFLVDQFVENSPENVTLGVAGIEYLAEESSLAEIKVKQRGAAQLLFQNKNDQYLVKYGNLAFVAILPMGIGLVRFFIRRRKRNLKYQFS